MAVNFSFSDGTFTRGGIDRAGKEFAQNGKRINDVQKYRAFRMECVSTSLGILERAHLPARAYVGIRLKRLDSIRRKLTRKNQNFNLSGLDDIIGIRLICASFDEVKSVSDSIARLPESVGVKDYTNQVHYVQTGYRAIHHIMKFPQVLSPQQKINVRFEIQIRSYYQHLWAVWSEKYGENIKQGGGSNQTKREQEILDELKSLSERIKKWEDNNPSAVQDAGKLLPPYRNNRVIATVRKQPDGKIATRIYNNHTSAVRQLNYWEEEFPHSRSNALLLVGIANEQEIVKVLNATHPLYAIGRVPHPKILMPDIFK